MSDTEKFRPREERSTYRAVLNFLTNTLGINRPNVEKMAQERIDRHVNRYMDELFSSQGFQAKLSELISRGIGRVNEYTRQMNGPTLPEMVQTEITRQVRDEVQRIIYANLKVELNYPAKES